MKKMITEGIEKNNAKSYAVKYDFGKPRNKNFREFKTIISLLIMLPPAAI